MEKLPRRLEVGSPDSRGIAMQKIANRVEGARLASEELGV